MTELRLPPLDQIAAEMRRDLPGVAPAELHGSLCGYLSGGPVPDRTQWLAQVMSDAGVVEPAQGSALDRLYAASLAQLDSPDMEFEMLLPDVDAPVNERGDAMVAWCRGFIGGFGLASGQRPNLSEDAEEALSDIANIAAREIDYEDPETDEQALEEVVEFIRVAVLLLHSDCVLGPRHRRSLN